MIHEKNSFFSLALAFVLSSTTLVSASAATDSDGSYGYLNGQQKNSERHAQYEQVATFCTDAERSAFFAKNDIGGAYSDAKRLDVDALVDAGIIDSSTADGIHQYATDKHTQLSRRYDSLENMTPTERHTYYDGFDRNGGNSVDALLSAGVITNEQAEAINSYLTE